jgi:hypothetical protein
MTDENKGNLSETIEEAVKIAEDTVRHPYTKRLARLGFYTKGFLFIVIGVLAILVAFGVKKEQLADPTGALARIAREPYGKVALIIFIVGAIGHGAWNILRGVADVDNAGGKIQGIFKRSLAVGVGFFYLFLAWTGWSIVAAVNTAVQHGAIQKTFTSILLALPLGAFLVIIIGLGVIGAGIHECYSGITGKYQENYLFRKSEGESRKFISVLGFLSFLARALIFALMGYFFIAAAIDYNPDEVVGIDGALLALSQTYYGKTILFVTASGLVCHGILSLYEARYRRIC